MRLLTAAAVILLLIACVDSSSQDGEHTAGIAVFGTVVEVTLRAVDGEQAEAAVAAITRDFQAMHHQWHPWNPGPLVDLNRALAHGNTGEVPDSMIPLIIGSTELYRRSDGLFNPAIGGLLELWGFHSSTRPQGPPPSAEAIQRWVESTPSMDDLQLDGNQLRSGNPAVQLDFGAYAKGHAVDQAIAHLVERGIEHAIVNAGGDLRAIGDAGGRPWRVGVRHPEGDRGEILATLEIAHGEAVFTSGHYERFREDEGIRYSHILDPRTGWPVDRITSVTVVHDNAAVADAAATALVVAGPDHWQRIARQMGIRFVMLVDDTGTIHMTPEMEQRIEF